MRSGREVNVAAGLVLYPLMVLGVAALFTAANRLWTGTTVLGAPVWRTWLLLGAGGTALCVAVALL